MPQPLYDMVEQALAARITDQMHPGDRLPTEQQLSDQFEVSRITVRRAMANLSARGLVRVVQGKGAFAAQPAIRQPLVALTGFVEDMTAIGLDATAELVSFTEIAAPRHVADALALPPGAAVVRIERTRMAQRRPVSFDITYLPAELGRPLQGDDLTHEPIFALLEQRYGVPLRHADYELRATAADAEVAAALDCAPGAPLFHITRTSYTDDGRPVDYELLHYRGDAVTFTTRLDRPA
ncbi:GntR family transcriptional regulator [Microbacterium luticocti]|uniref:GntR family transcriptional regulator n=1 Tax=Microbacterium luticocti TaxID=451764 RepID=UPI0004218A9D|nr:GntR family transcriptional regulator [Microbacterium luticocti]